MITKLRKKLGKSLFYIGKVFALLRIPPNLLTMLSLIVMITGFYLFIIYDMFFIYILFIILSSFLDVADGAVARYSGRVTRFGGFLDSTVDRINDFILILSLKYMGFNEFIVYVLIILSFLISYSRARAEGLGLKIEGIGLIERGERILFLIVIIVFSIYIYNVAKIILYVLVLLSLITLIQRILFIYKSLK
ncbi:MAG: CDP-alcohol phosphatidyltransferase family protein [Thermoprotei archaeon]|nr:MAG: CDP-alcohol phosphatidyltransferase family protein [Thermoprotei archaeon]